MSESAGEAPGATRYEIRVKGVLGPRWAEWFDGLDLAACADGTTVLEGPIVDQAALHGVLRRIADLGLPLVSLTPVPDVPPTTDHHDR
jgi:hypothetical protein